MTTIRQINKLVAPLLSPASPLTQTAEGLSLRPVHHVINQLVVWRTGAVDYFDVIWHCCPAFAARFTAEWGTTFLAAPRQLWRWSTPGIHERFVACVNEEILPRMRAAGTLDGFLQLVAEPDFEARRLVNHVDTDIRIDIAYGDLDTALVKCRSLQQRCALGPDSHWGRIWRRTTEPAGPLLEAGDRQGLIALLHEWERELIARKGLEAIYEPTPFPLELTSGV